MRKKRLRTPCGPSKHRLISTDDCPAPVDTSDWAGDVRARRFSQIAYRRRARAACLCAKGAASGSTWAMQPTSMRIGRSYPRFAIAAGNPERKLWSRASTCIHRLSRRGASYGLELTVGTMKPASVGYIFATRSAKSLGDGSRQLIGAMREGPAGGPSRPRRNMISPAKLFFSEIVASAASECVVRSIGASC